MDYGAFAIIGPINNYCICLYSPYTYVLKYICIYSLKTAVNAH